MFLDHVDRTRVLTLEIKHLLPHSPTYRAPRCVELRHVLKIIRIRSKLERVRARAQQPLAFPHVSFHVFAKIQCPDFVV